MNTQTQLDRFREAANRAAPPASTVMFEMIARIEEMEKHGREPCCWASEHVVPLRGLKDNHRAILTATKCLANQVPLYLSPPAPAVPDAYVDAAKWRNTVKEACGLMADAVDQMKASFSSFQSGEIIDQVVAQEVRDHEDVIKRLGEMLSAARGGL